jgi:hypothetical protein
MVIFQSLEGDTLLPSLAVVSLSLVDSTDSTSTTSITSMFSNLAPDPNLLPNL